MMYSLMRVVEDALAFQLRLLGGVEGGGVVLEILDERAGLRTLVENLGSCPRKRACDDCRT